MSEHDFERRCSHDLKFNLQDNILWNQTNVDRLRKDLLKDYDVNARPEHYMTQTQCNISITVLSVDLDEARGVLITHSWMKMMWTDSKLVWDNNSYGGISDLHFAADEVSSRRPVPHNHFKTSQFEQLKKVWQPDLSVYNSAEANIVDHFMKTNKIVYSMGKVLWVS